MFAFSLAAFSLGYHAGTSGYAAARARTVALSASVRVPTAAETAIKNYKFRLEYSVSTLSDKLGVSAPIRFEGCDDDTWLSILEEVLPSLERQWSSAARNRAMLLDPMMGVVTPTRNWPAAVVPSAAETARRKLLFRLEYSVNSLSDKLGVPAPLRLPSYDDDTWVGVLEEVLPYLERQWSTAAKAKANELEETPFDALEPGQRIALRERYVQRLEADVARLSMQQDVVSAVSAVPIFSERVSDENYIAELEEVVCTLQGKFSATSSAAW